MSLQDIDALTSFKKLTHLCMLENPITKNRDFRWAPHGLQRLWKLSIVACGVQGHGTILGG
jgi:hypothetical protein